ncbi:MAG TPA: carboxyl transferase domain-containing protein, partial [Thermoanaerobaculia bacterium]|nr:carboxyl transferase domain-containing protein [Thermoanaerobaculia bacterium]
LSSALLEIMLRRYYRLHPLSAVREILCGELRFIQGDYEHRGVRVRVLATHAPYEHLRQTFAALTRQIAETPRDGRELAIDLYVWSQWRQWRQASAETLAADAVAAELSALLASHGFPPGLRRVAVSLSGPQGFEHFTYRPTEGTPGYTEDRLQRGLHPMVAQRLELWRLLNFRLERLPAPEGVFLFLGVAAENPRDARLFALAEVRDLTPLGDSADRTVQLPELEHTLLEALAGIRHFQARRTAGERLLWNRVLLNIWPPVDLPPAELHGLLQRLAPLGEGLGLEKVVVRFRIPQAAGGETQDRVLEISDPGESGMRLRFRKPSTAPLKPLREYAQKVVELRRRGLLYPYELIKRLAAPRQAAPTDLPPGDFTEYDLAPGDPSRLVPVARPYGGNTANIVLGVIRSYTERYPEGMARVLLIGDPSHSMGSLAEPECRRILGALDLASTLGVPVEWFAVSSGARIAMDSGTENMDWIARVLRRIVTFTDQGGEINLVVAAINAGAQPYWNAAATMLMHTRGILIMTPEGTMVLTGKQALDYSGGVSAEDNQGIGGYERIMGPNGEAQYFARDVAEACRLLLAHYEHTYKAPGELFPRPAASRDPRQRDVRAFPHGGAFETVGDVFSEATNPGRKRPFEIRRVMSAVVDQDLVPLERWYGMRGAEIAVVWEAHLGGYPVCLLGFESKPLPRLEPRPVDGPRQWTGSTLFPAAAKKVARAIHAASGNRPLVVLANLSGFDGSPESMRLAQLEHGAEIGRAIVEFRGPIVLCVVSRFHGGAFVVFSQALNDNLEVAALEGSHASVLGGTTAAAMVFGREVDRRAWEDPRLAGFTGDRATAVEGEKAPLFAAVRAEKLGEVAAELDRIHDISRAQEKGSVHHVLPPERLRPYLIEAVERGMAKSLRTGL